jgi:dihydrofolate reductase
VTVSLIWAQAANGVIGCDGQLPWHIPEDMAHFRQLTMGHTVVMGRRTWDSVPERFRPLPGRRNVVLSRAASYDAPGATVVTSLEAALEGDDEIWVAGGAQIYAAALPRADRLVVTDVDLDVAGDVHAPEIGPEWIEAGRDPETGWHESSTGVRFCIRRFGRRS